ncbi:hypothetical protein M231_04197 [Tremella mesenterica]|uniref:UDP-glycosyltransferases domain-containing protein n=1 Tax=Tremella mesenterica TaxID=5217 RepID=A0A4Q1BLC4_TREME|nr:uncharacterized protein TREMEDRAFT_59765 [Tremella mesenterica DSM 1558]EIW73591.1 hypothetical protein TREMEDRAFT_59765 [Tremella mesenterica DSM 1558]RXK38564.1 hypothetical protein M231_04197 [Tremella mesenterica]
MSAAFSLLLANPALHCTFLPDRRGANRIAQELSTRPDLVVKCKQRFRVLSVVDPNGPDLGEDQDKIGEELKTHFEAYLKPVMAGDDSEKGFGIKPKVVIMDLFRGPQCMGVVQKVATELGRKEQVKLLISLSITNMGLKLVLESNARVDAAVAEGKQLDEAVEEIASYDRIIDPLDIPARPQWEFHPQVGSWQFDSIVPALKMPYFFSPAFKHCDGMIINGVPELEPKAAATLSGLLGHPVYTIGYDPTEVSGKEDIPELVNNPRYPTDDGRVKKFLDECLAHYGENSVVYISLGQVGWPFRRPELIDNLVNSLLDAGIPFLFALAATDAELTPETLAKVQASDKAEISSWVNQREVLKHSAVSTFVTHMGPSGMYESLIAGKPMIAVPQFSQHPVNTMLMTSLGCCIQLYQFSTGHDGKTFSNGVKVNSATLMRKEMDEVWVRKRGEEGTRLRENVQKVRARIIESWERGESKKALDALADIISE